MIAALFVDPRGVYSGLDDVECWGEEPVHLLLREKPSPSSDGGIAGRAQSDSACFPIERLLYTNP